MANEREIIIVVSADGTAAIKGISDVGDSTEGLGKKTASATESIRKNWLAVTAGITGAYLALQKMWQTMDEAAQTQEAFDVLDSLASRYNTTAEELTATISRNSQGLIGNAAAARISADAMAKGFTPEQLANVARWAPTIDDFSHSVRSSAEAYETLVNSMAAGRERGVVQLLGATISLSNATEGVADKMTKAEKATALYNAVAERMAKIQREVGTEQNSAADRMERFNNQVAQAKFFLGQLLLVVGGPFMAVFQGVGSVVYGLVGGILSVIATTARLTDELGITKGKAEEWQRSSDAWFSRSATLAEATKNSLAGAYEQMKQLGSYSSGAKQIGQGVDLGFGAAGDAERKSKLDGIKDNQDWALSLELVVKRYEAVQNAMHLIEPSKDLIPDTQDWALDLGTIVRQYEATQNALNDTNLTLERRIELEREVLDLNSRQAELASGMRIRYAQEALDAIGARAAADSIGTFAGVAEGVDPYRQDFDRWSSVQDEKIQRMIELGATEAQLRDDYRQYDLMQEQMVQQQKLAIASAGFGMMAGMAKSFYALSNQQSVAAFRAYQVFSIAETVINTHKAAMAAYAFGAKFGGPALGAAFAAAAIAAGMAQVAAIASQKAGGGSGVSSSPGGGAPALASAYAEPAEKKEPERSSQVVNIHVYAQGSVGVDEESLDAFARKMAGPLVKAYGDNAQ